ncbi:MAG TPA: hypothetical protein VMT56_00305 [Candidatus Bathyarchaeia archaeon]|nr:hypothetical protein [Candidatus Bathyarchaeia archaeon]
MDTRDLATRLVDAKMQDGGGRESEVDMLHELLRDFHDSLHAGDFASAASHFRGAFQLLESEPHEEYGEEGEGYSQGGYAEGGTMPPVRSGAPFATSSVRGMAPRRG